MFLRKGCTIIFAMALMVMFLTAFNGGSLDNDNKTTAANQVETASSHIGDSNIQLSTGQTNELEPEYISIPLALSGEREMPVDVGLKKIEAEFGALVLLENGQLWNIRRHDDGPTLIMDNKEC